MKILLTTDTYMPIVNGVVVSIANLYKQLTLRGHEVKIITLSDSNASYKAGDVYYVRSFKLNYIYPGVRGTIAYKHSFLTELVEWKPDIIHSQTEFFTFAYAKKIAQMLNIPTVHTYHTLYEDYTGYLLGKNRFGKLSVAVFSKERLKKIDVIVAPTLKVRDVLRGYGMKNDIRIIPTGIDLSAFTAPTDEENIQRLRHDLKIPDDCKVFVTVGRLGSEKNFDETIDNFAALYQRDNKIRLVIVGDGPYKEDLQKHVHRVGMENQIIFTGMVRPIKIHLYYKMADVYVSASKSETQGLTYIEAMASGTPVLCKEDRCLEGLVQHEHNGFLYNTQEEFCNYASQLFAQKELRDELSRNARNTAQDYSSERFAERMVELYHELIEKSKEHIEG